MIYTRITGSASSLQALYRNPVGIMDQIEKIVELPLSQFYGEEFTLKMNDDTLFPDDGQVVVLRITAECPDAACDWIFHRDFSEAEALIKKMIEPPLQQFFGEGFSLDVFIEHRLF